MRSSTSGKPSVSSVNRVNIDTAPLCGGSVFAAERSSGMDRLDTDVIRLLVPIKNAKEISYGVRYASNLRDRGFSVKICLLHVAEVNSGDGVSSPRRGRDFNTADDVLAQSLIAEASALLNASRIRHDCHHRRGDVMFMIFDSAELFDCHEIVLPESRHPFLSRIFSNSLARKLMRSRRSVPVVMVNANGLICTSSADHEFSDQRMRQSGECADYGVAGGRWI